MERQLPAWSEKVWDILKKSIGGFLGVTGFLFSLVMVPIYLFFFLKERPRIEKRWKDYLPLRPSPFKDEVAEALLEINQLHHRLFPRTVAGLSGGWSAHWQRSHPFSA